ncbi:MAG: hypothetical protein CM1200mP30_20870 [Pseudomonadota bacterium]|nr:MAG: hypothetical protein CM1200mP30_20870 [Pseudomonadota bacterium]
MASVSLKNLNKYFGNTLVVNNVSVELLMENSWCLLGLLVVEKQLLSGGFAGLESISDGEFKSGSYVNHLPLEGELRWFSRISFVFHMTVGRTLDLLLKHEDLTMMI